MYSDCTDVGRGLLDRCLYPGRFQLGDYSLFFLLLYNIILVVLWVFTHLSPWVWGSRAVAVGYTLCSIEHKTLAYFVWLIL